MNTYTAGRKVRVSVAYTDANLIPLDPTTVSLKYDTAAIAVVPQAYNPGNIIKDSVGNYHYDIDTTALSGLVTYEFLSTGVGQDSAIGYFLVTPLPF